MAEDITTDERVEKAARILHAIGPGTTIEYYRQQLTRRPTNYVGFPLADCIQVSHMLAAVDRLEGKIQ